MIFHWFDRRYFEKVFAREDPWGYISSAYEKTKYLRQIRTLRQFCPEPDSILEVGCAEGVYTAMLAEVFPGARITGIDISRSAIERARQNCKPYPNAIFVEADMVELLRRERLPPNSFDIIIQSEILYYLFSRLIFQLNLHTYLRGSLRLLRRRGVFIMSNGIDIQTRPIMEVYYFILRRLCDPQLSVRYQEWNELRKKYLAYDVKVFRPR